MNPNDVRLKRKVPNTQSMQHYVLTYSTYTTTELKAEKVRRIIRSDKQPYELMELLLAGLPRNLDTFPQIKPYKLPHVETW